MVVTFPPDTLTAEADSFSTHSDDSTGQAANETATDFTWTPTAARLNPSAYPVDTCEVVRREVYARVDYALDASRRQSSVPLVEDPGGAAGNVAASSSSAVVVITAPIGPRQAQQLAIDLRERERPTSVVEIEVHPDNSASVIRQMAMGGYKQISRDVRQRRREEADNSWTRVEHGLSRLGGVIHDGLGWVARSHPFGSPFSLGDMFDHTWARFRGLVQKIKVNLFVQFEIGLDADQAAMVASKYESWSKRIERVGQAAHREGRELAFVIREAHRMPRSELVMVCQAITSAREKGLPVVLVLWGGQTLEQLLGSVSPDERAAASVTRLYHLTKEQLKYELAYSGLVPLTHPECDAIAAAALRATTTQLATPDGRAVHAKRVRTQTLFLWDDGAIHTGDGLVKLLNDQRRELHDSPGCDERHLYDVLQRPDGTIAVTWQNSGTEEETRVIEPLHIQPNLARDPHAPFGVLKTGGMITASEGVVGRHTGGRLVPGLSVDSMGRVVAQGQLGEVAKVVGEIRKILSVEGRLSAGLVDGYADRRSRQRLSVDPSHLPPRDAVGNWNLPSASNASVPARVERSLVG